MGIHTFAVLCMLYNPTMCIDYEIVPDNFSPVTSLGYCMKGGAIFATLNPGVIEIGGIQYVAKGVHCKGNPPTASEIDEWVAGEKERLSRMMPQTR
jgi:hypothetical protein